MKDLLSHGYSPSQIFHFVLSSVQHTLYAKIPRSLQYHCTSTTADFVEYSAVPFQPFRQIWAVSRLTEEGDGARASAARCFTVHAASTLLKIGKDGDRWDTATAQNDPTSPVMSV